MAIIVKRPDLKWYELIYLPALVGGFATTLRHMFAVLLGKVKVTMEYPEEKWTLPRRYRGAPTLVRDEDGREKCVACQLCEFVCPPRAIRVSPAEIPAGQSQDKIEKYPEQFEINMLRCIYCGFCEEVCPEQAIFLRNEYGLTGFSRRELLHQKLKLYAMGGVREDPIHKWKKK